MLITCSNKGCLKSSTVLLNLATMEVICQECGKPILGVSDAMKRVLKSVGQVVRSNVKKAFTIHCRNCNANRELVLTQTNDTVCKVCHKPVVIHASFRIAMEEAGEKLEKITLPDPQEKQ